MVDYLILYMYLTQTLSSATLSLVSPKIGVHSLVSTIEKQFERKSSGSGLENRDYGRRGSTALTTRHSSIRKSWH
jgi:hypothetical protein